MEVIMKPICAILFIPCIIWAKEVHITGPITAPWVKGTLCASYRHKQEKKEHCFTIGAGQEYVIRNIPDRINRIKIKRMRKKTCITRKDKNICRFVSGRFYIKDHYNLLDLTYNTSHVKLNYTIPPKEPNSWYGVPHRQPALARTRLATINGGGAFA
jgi:hypothetical protein